MNRAPAVGELNGDRSNKRYGIVPDERRDYGACDFEIGGNPKVTEPRDEVRGDAARLYMYPIIAVDVKYGICGASNSSRAQVVPYSS